MPKVAAANLTHRRAHSYGKPVAAKRSSENILPNLKPGQHPSLHRSNHSAHEFGHPYKVRKFNASTGQLHLSAQRSLDSLPLHPQVSQTQPSTPYPSFTFSEHQEPMHIKTEHEDPAMTHSATMDAPNPFPDLNMSLMNSALSPANPARYSMNDFSNFNWPGFTSNDLGDQTSAVSAMSEQDSYDWSSTTGDSPYQYNHAPQQLHQRSSIVSLDQPGLTHSPSASTSDIGDLAMSVPDINYRSSPMASMTVDPSWMSKDADDLTGAGLNMPPYQGVTHDLVYRPSQQSAATFDDYFTAPVMNPAPSQTQADPYDESHFLTPTHERGRYAPQSLAPAVKFDDYEAWSTHLSPPDINFELQHQQQHNPQSMYPNNGQTGPW
ncbi:MAG: hypothetical protein M1828_004097 [Chrysothrix sp. TS-e1954]|nr:MAG: hypothetical protein M1828_004097 [Chrysothrix sp. TS-e1954]